MELKPSPDGSKYAIGTIFGVIGILDATTFQALPSIGIGNQEVDGQQIVAIDWSPDGKYIATGNMKREVTLWDTAVRDAAIVTIYSSFYGGNDREQSIMRAVAFSPTGGILRSVGGDGSLLSSRVPSGRSLDFVYLREEIHTAAFNADGSKLAYALTVDEPPTIIEFPDDSEIEGFIDESVILVWSPEGDKIAVGSRNGALQVWSAATNELLADLSGHTHDVIALAWSPDNIHLVSSGYDKTVRVWNVTTGQNEATFNGPQSKVIVVAWSPDGSQIIAVAADGQPSLFVWDITTGQLVVNQNSVRLYDIQPSPDGSRYAIASAYGIIGMWDVNTFEFLPSIDNGSQTGPSMTRIDWSSDGNRIAIGNMAHQVMLWDTAVRDTPLAILPSTDFQGNDWEQSIVRAVAFNPTDSILRSMNGDGTIRAWSVPDGELLDTVNLDEIIYAAGFSADGNRLAYALISDEPPTIIEFTEP